MFCGSRPGTRPEYAEAATAMGRALVEEGMGLVYGGGRVGLMGMVADAVMRAGGEVIGVIPEALMADLSDGFVAMPGGYGTFEEFCEVITWSQLGIHPKPCGLLNVSGFYGPLLAMFDHAVAEGFVPPQHRTLVLEDTTPAGLIEKLRRFTPPVTEKWILPGER